MYTILYKIHGLWHFNIIDKTLCEYTGSIHGFGWVIFGKYM